MSVLHDCYREAEEMGKTVLLSLRCSLSLFRLVLSSAVTEKSRSSPLVSV